MSKNKQISVLNRGTGEVGYTIAESGIRRVWTPGEIKKNLTYSELEQVTYIPGGLKLLQKYLVINDPEVCEQLGLQIEPEYYYTEKEIEELLTKGTIEQLLDCLDFAPEGVIDLIKKKSIELKLNDVQKREAILNSTGFNVTAAINNVAYSQENDSETTKKTNTRRTKPITNKEESNSGRRAKPLSE